MLKMFRGMNLEFLFSFLGATIERYPTFFPEILTGTVTIVVKFFFLFLSLTLVGKCTFNDQMKLRASRRVISKIQGSCTYKACGLFVFTRVQYIS